jgi:hypothetical protein
VPFSEQMDQVKRAGKRQAAAFARRNRTTEEIMAEELSNETGTAGAEQSAMFLRGGQARFTDPDSGEIVHPGSYPHQVSDFVIAALGNNLRLLHLGEHSANAEFASQYPRCEKYIGWPMLLVLGLAR